MKTIILKITLALSISLLMYSCVDKPDFSDIPNIKFESISRTHVNQFDSLWLTLSFEDGDGNLGKLKGSSANCNSVCEYDSDTSCFKDPYYGAFLIDMRDSCFVNIFLPDFEPDGNVKAVSGELKINIPPVFCKLQNCTNCTEDTLVYKIIVRDASLNWSNTILSDTIFITCN